MSIIDDFGSILHSLWEPHHSCSTEIIGKWAEDGSEYTIIVPYQLRDTIVSLQNNLHFRYAKYQSLLEAIKELENKLIYILS